MKTFKITFYQTTKKGKINELQTFLINSNGDNNEVKKYYQSRYKHLNIDVSEIEVVDTVEFEVERIVKKTSSYDYRYNASISFKEIDIENFGELLNKYTELLKSKKDIEEQMKNQIINRYNLNGVKMFEVNENRVRFDFTDVIFNKRSL